MNTYFHLYPSIIIHVPLFERSCFHSKLSFSVTEIFKYPYVIYIDCYFQTNVSFFLLKTFWIVFSAQEADCNLEG